MNARSIPRTAINSYLKLVRLPLDGAIGLLPGNGTGAGPTARLALDKAEARIRAALASILNDAAMQEDAQRRRAAADEREQAARLRSEAQHTSAEADVRHQRRQQQAVRKRERSDERASAQRRSAQRKREEKTERATEAERRRIQESQKASEKQREALETRARDERLQTLNVEAEALEKRGGWPPPGGHQPRECPRQDSNLRPSD